MSVFEVPISHRNRDVLHAHSGFDEIYYQRTGEGVQYVEDRVVRMRPGDWFFFPAGQLHGASSVRGSECRAAVCYVPEFLFSPQGEGDCETHRILGILRQDAREGRNRVVLSEDSRMRVEAALQEMLGELKGLQRGYASALKLWMQKMLLEVLRGAALPWDDPADADSGQGPERIRRVLWYLDEHFSRPISVDMVAGMAHLSRSHFHALFRKVTGVTLVDYVNRRRVQEMARMLQETALPVERVAGLSGFTSMSHMYYVHRKFGMKPPRKVRCGS